MLGRPTVLRWARSLVFIALVSVAVASISRLLSLHTLLAPWVTLVGLLALVAGLLMTFPGSVRSPRTPYGAEAGRAVGLKVLLVSAILLILAWLLSI